MFIDKTDKVTRINVTIYISIYALNSSLKLCFYTVRQTFHQKTDVPILTVYKGN